MADRSPVHPNRPRFFVPVGLVLLTTGVLGALLAQVGCTPDSSPEPATEGEGYQFDPATQDTIDQLFGPADPPPTGPDAAAWPALEFEPLSEGLPFEGTWRERPLLHDFDGDGRADLIASNREEDGLNAWKTPGPGGGPFELRIEGLPRDLMYGGCDAADLDGDGHEDLVFVAHGEGLTVFRGDGKLGWTQGDPLENPFLMLDVALGDLDGDGKHDAVGIGHFEGGVSAYLGDGKGGFTRLQQSNRILPRSRFGTRIEVADMDADGLDDLVVTAEKGPTVLYTRRNEQSGDLFWEDGSEGLPRPDIGNSLRGVVPGDFDGDGVLDLAVCALSNPGIPEPERENLGVYRLVEGVWKRMDQGLPSHLSFEDIAAGDVDKDGHLDLVVAAGQVGVLLYLGDGAGGFTCRGLLKDSWVADRLTLGDANGDGWLDIAVLSSDTKYNRTAGGLVVWMNRKQIWGP